MAPRVSFHRIAAALVLFAAEFAAAQEITVRGAVSTQELYLGEEMIFQIQIEGSDQPGRPNLPASPDFTIAFESEQANNSYSISIVNGTQSESVQKGYLFNYRLVPTRTGTLAIPRFTVTVAGVGHQTDEIAVQVRRPAETDDYKLRLELSKGEAYVGEPITLSVLWYWNPEKPVTRLSNLSIPAFALDEFRAVRTDENLPAGAQAIELPVAGENEVFIQTDRNLGGRPFTTLELKRILVPKQAGRFELPAASVVFDAVTGYRQTQDFFGFNTQQEITEKFVVPSNSLALSVSELPPAGRPDGFSGLVGEYFIDVTASNTLVNVGDPITLTLRVSGTGYLGDFTLPPLADISPIAGDFKIPEERSAGRSEGGDRIFTQTIRAKKSGTIAIPSIALHYFNPSTGRYAESKSNPIPVEVKETRIVTIGDVEGDQPVDAKTGVETLAEGIAYNYTDLDVLENRYLGIEALTKKPLRIASLAAAPLAFLILLIASGRGRRRAESTRERQARGAFREFLREIKRRDRPDGTADPSLVLDAIRRYLGLRLNRPPGSLTASELAAALAERHADEETINTLLRIIETCEGGRYGGMAPDAAAELPERATAAIRDIEGGLP